MNPERQLADMQAEARRLREQLAIERNERAAIEQQGRGDSIETWLSEMTRGPAPRLLPAEKPMVRYLLRFMTEHPGEHSYAASPTEHLAPAQVLQRLYEQRDTSALAPMFSEVSRGDSTRTTTFSTTQDARAEATRRAKEYMAEHRTKDFRRAFEAVLALDADLKAAAAGIRPEGMAKDAEGLAAFEDRRGRDGIAR